MKNFKKLICISLVFILSLAFFPACKGRGFSVTPSVPPGIYTAEQTVELASRDGGPIFYTTDGSTPAVLLSDGAGGYTETGSTKLYKNPILIQDRASQRPRLAELGKDMWISSLKGNYNGEPEDYIRGTVIKAVTQKRNGIPSEVWTGSYLTMTQTDASALDLPILSIALPEACLFSYRTDRNPVAPDGGIYRYPDNPIEYEASFEFFDKDRNLIFLRNGGIKVSSGKNAGGAPMKSFNVNLVRNDNDKPVAYAMWDNANVTEFSRFRLRNAGESYVNGGFNQVLAQSLSDILLPANASAVYTAVFLNGDFWGIYALEEHYSSPYLAAHYGDQARNMVQIGFDSGCKNEPSVEDGDEAFATASYQAMYQFADANPMFTDAILSEFEKKYLAVDEYIDQTLAHIFFNCSDYPGNNNRMWRVQNTHKSNPYADGRWRPMLYDLDRAFSSDYDIGYDMLGHLLGEFAAPSSVGGANRNPEWSTLFFRRLWTNEGFRTRFLQGANYFNDTVLDSQRVSDYADRIYNQLKNSQPLQTTRWMLSDNLAANRDSYKEWIETRKALVMTQIAQRLS